MDLYSQVSARIARLLTHSYSTSFSSASRLFPKQVQFHIYNIYGLVRIADEIVDTYAGIDQAELLERLRQECYESLQRRYSPNPIVQAFSDTAVAVGIGAELIDPFFESMCMDLSPVRYDQAAYERYIYGSAEVIGLMCLKVFCVTDQRRDLTAQAQYEHLAAGARRLGAAYQKVNFLRDLAADHGQLGRFYFPNASFESFDETVKQSVTTDIRHDFEAAWPYVKALPPSVRSAVMTSYRYYEQLLTRLEQADVARIKAQRIRLPGYQKALLLAPQLLPRISRRAHSRSSRPIATQKGVN